MALWLMGCGTAADGAVITGAWFSGTAAGVSGSPGRSVDPGRDPDALPVVPAAAGVPDAALAVVPGV